MTPRRAIFHTLLIAGLVSGTNQAGQEPSVNQPLRSGHQQDVTKFYLEVHELTQSPPPKPALVDSCETKVGNRFVTFIGVGKEKAFIVALTEHRLLNPSQDISLEPLFVIKRGVPHPVGYDPRSKTATMDWAYVFDRNGDGKIDYLAYLESPMFVRPEEYEGELPVIMGRITGTVLKMAIKNTRMVFWHMSDDNVDGQHDGLVVSLRDDRTGWVDSWLFARDTDFNGTYDQCSYFDKKFLAMPHDCARLEDKYHVPGKRLLGLREVPPRFDLLKQFNEGAAKCKFRASAFYQGINGIREDLSTDRLGNGEERWTPTVDQGSGADR